MAEERCPQNEGRSLRPAITEIGAFRGHRKGIGAPDVISLKGNRNTQEQMLEKKTEEFVLPEESRRARRMGRRIWMGTLAILLTAATGAATAQNAQVQNTPQVAPKPKPKVGFIAPVTYDN